MKTSEETTEIIYSMLARAVMKRPLPCKVKLLLLTLIHSAVFLDPTKREQMTKLSQMTSVSPRTVRRIIDQMDEILKAENENGTW